MLCRVPPSITLEKLKLLSKFLPGWATEKGWPEDAPITREERNAISYALWKEEEITWLRVLGTVLNPQVEKHYLEYLALRHFQIFPAEMDRMFTYWIRSKHLKAAGRALLQAYCAVKAGAYYPALIAVIPFAETVMRAEGVRKLKHFRKFFDKYGDGLGVPTAKVFAEYFYESEPKGTDTRPPYNRHKLAHGLSEAVAEIDLVAGCLFVDMVVSVAETEGHLFDRIPHSEP